MKKLVVLLLMFVLLFSVQGQPLSFKQALIEARDSLSCYQEQKTALLEAGVEGSDFWVAIWKVDFWSDRVDFLESCAKFDDMESMEDEYQQEIWKAVIGFDELSINKQELLKVLERLDSLIIQTDSLY